jgi:hypothetical protein
MNHFHPPALYAVLTAAVSTVRFIVHKNGCSTMQQHSKLIAVLTNVLHAASLALHASYTMQHSGTKQYGTAYGCNRQR